MSKSLLGKAHTVMAEGGIAASLGNVHPDDSWEVHFGDTMRGGQQVNQYQMAEIHAKESPDRVYELERWGALFDRTPEGYIMQRAFGAHTYTAFATWVTARASNSFERSRTKRFTAASTSTWKPS